MSPQAHPPHPPPLMSEHFREVDLENEPPPNANVSRRPATVRKRLFRTPAAKPTRPPATPSPTHLLTKDSITRRFYRNRTPVATPLPSRPSLAPSTARRPAVTRLHATPSRRRRVVGTAPDQWRARQAADLTAWLNHELAAASGAPTLPLDNVATSVVYLRQVAALHAVYRSPSLVAVLSRLADEIAAANLCVSRSIKLASFLKERDQLVALLLLSYHPHWLLLALSVTLGVNLGADLDAAVARTAAHGVCDHEQVLMQALEDALRDVFLADAPSAPVASRERRSPASEDRDRYNALILHRALSLVYLLDVAKRQHDAIIDPDPPLFRDTAEVTSSADVLRQLQAICLQEHGDVVRFLSRKGFRVHYESPLFERAGSLRITNLEEDLRDGTKLCKLASIMTRDRDLLTLIRRARPGMLPKLVYANNVKNVHLALNAMQACLPAHVAARFSWLATPHDIATGALDKTLAAVWQIAALWMDVVVLREAALKDELETVKDQFRFARRNPESPSQHVSLDLTPLADSPSKLQIIESCESISSDLLLRWVATLCGIYGVTVRDFTEDFRDGAALCLILHHYCPDIMRIDEIIRIPAAERRTAFDAEAENVLVQKNLDLFTSRCRLLGTIPHIEISAKATLAPSFRESLKEESVGRVMQILTSYIFRRMVLQRDSTDAHRQVQEIMDNHVGASEMLPESAFHPELDSRGDCGAGGLTPRRANNLRIDHPTHTDVVPREDSDDALHGRGGTDSPDIPRDIEDSAEPHAAEALHPDSAFPCEPAADDGDDFAGGNLVVSSPQVHAQSSAGPPAAANTESVVASDVGQQADASQRKDDPSDSNQALDSAQQSSHLVEPQHSPDPSESSSPSVHLLDERRIALPGRLLEQMSNLLPAFRDHVIAIENYSQRMLAHEKAQQEEQAAIVVQTAVRSRLARQERVETQDRRSTLRKTLFNCASQAANFALQAAERRRREIARSFEEAMAKALASAEEAYEDDMSNSTERRQKAEGIRLRANQRLARESTRFEEDVRRQQQAFDAEMSTLQENVGRLDSILDNEALQDLQTTPVLSPEGEVLDKLSDSVARSTEAENAFKKAASEVESETTRADALESDLLSLRLQEREIEKEMRDAKADLEGRLSVMQSELHQWRVAILQAACVVAEARYDFHMQKLSLQRLDEAKERHKQLMEQEQELLLLQDQEARALAEEQAILAKLNADNDALRELMSNRLSLLSYEKPEEQSFASEREAVLAQMDQSVKDASRVDAKWNVSVQEYDTNVSGSASTLLRCEEVRKNDDSVDEHLDRVISRLELAERRENQEQRLQILWELATTRFHAEMESRRENLENNLFAREEVLRELEDVDLEAMQDAKELAQEMESHAASLKTVEARWMDSEALLYADERRLDDKSSEGPYLLHDPGCDDLLGEQLAEEYDFCEKLYADTCEIMEHLYVETGSEDDVLDTDESYASEVSPVALKSQSVLATPSAQGSQRGYEPDTDASDDNSSCPSRYSLDPNASLYSSLVEGELSYYNGDSKHDVGIQTESEFIFRRSRQSSPMRRSKELARPSRVESGQLTSEEQTKNARKPPREYSEASTSQRIISPPVVPFVRPSSARQSMAVEATTYEQLALRFTEQSDGQQGFYVDADHTERKPAAPHEVAADFTSLLDEVSKGDLSDNTSPAAPDYYQDLGAHNEDYCQDFGALDTLAQLALGNALDSRIAVNDLSSQEGYHQSKTLQNDDSENYDPNPILKEIEVAAVPGMRNGKRYAAQQPTLPSESPFKELGRQKWSISGGREGHAKQQSNEGTDTIVPVTEDVDEQAVPCTNILSSTAEIDSLGQHLQTIDVGREFQDFGALSAELNMFDIQPSRQSIQSLVEDSSSATKLQSVMRRISIAASSPQDEIKETSGSDLSLCNTSPCVNIIRAVFIVIRYCSRSGNQVELRELGVNIIKDMCAVQGRVNDVISVEDCLNVMSTCAQYHRDDEPIFGPAVEVLWMIASEMEGKKLFMRNAECVERLRRVNKLLAFQQFRERRNRGRLDQASLITEVVQRRRIQGGSSISLADDLSAARKHKPIPELPVRPSYRKLEELMNLLSS